MVVCNICGGPTEQIEVKEQMMGLQESFIYYKCLECGHTHLHTVPKDMHKYYDTKQYYSFRNNNNTLARIGSSIQTVLKKSLLNLKVKKSFLFSSALKPLLSIEKLNRNTKILDYGCGAGQFVKELNALGFINAKGFDPYLPKDENFNGEIQLTNALEKLQTRCWDVIVLNHVFEHLERPIEVLENLNKLLCLDGNLLLRFPIIDSFAFEKYRQKWVQFDAPRHINLFTRKSIILAVEKAGNYEIETMYDDSYHFQFTGSELYSKNLSLKPKDNSRIKRLLSLKTYKYHFLAKRLNKEKRGDQMVIILAKT